MYASHIPQSQHVDHVKVDNVKYFHSLVITNRAEEGPFRADGNAFYHTCTEEQQNGIIHRYCAPWFLFTKVMIQYANVIGKLGIFVYYFTRFLSAGKNSYNT